MSPQAPGKGSKFTRFLAVGCVIVLAVVGAVWWAFLGGNERQVTAYFTGALGAYPGGDVRVLGVQVGHIDSVEPQGKIVKVQMTLDKDTKIPANASAALISPSVVSDRYIQLAPVYKGGPELKDGAVIPKERTATPIELDQLYRSLNQLTTALGPQGANKDGALTDLLNSSAANLRGNGQALHDTLKYLGQSGQTLSGNSKELFQTVDNLQKFTSMLASNDTKVRAFNTQMQQVNQFMAGDRQDLGASLAELSQALGKVESFVRDNRQHLKTNVDQLNTIAEILVKQRNALSQGIDNGTLALSNLQNSYNAASGTLDTRANINELNQPPLLMLCKMLSGGAPPQTPPQLADACKQLKPVLDGAVPLPTPAQTINSMQQGQLPPLPLPLLRDSTATPASGGGR